MNERYLPVQIEITDEYHPTLWSFWMFGLRAPVLSKGDSNPSRYVHPLNAADITSVKKCHS